MEGRGKGKIKIGYNGEEVKGGGKCEEEEAERLTERGDMYGNGKKVGTGGGGGEWEIEENQSAEEGEKNSQARAHFFSPRNERAQMRTAGLDT